MPSGCNAIRRRKCPTIQQKNEWTQKWPYEKDALARESTLCVAGALIGWLWQIQNLYHSDVTVKEVNHIRCFAIAKYLILLSCHLAMEHLYVLQLETALATLVTTYLHIMYILGSYIINSINVGMHIQGIKPLLVSKI
jgi:hypothetical protein